MLPCGALVCDQRVKGSGLWPRRGPEREPRGVIICDEARRCLPGTGRAERRAAGRQIELQFSAPPCLFPPHSAGPGARP